MNGRGCGQVSKVMLAAQAQTQIQLEHGEISSLGSTELTHRMYCALKEHFLLLQFLLFSLSFSVLRGMRATSIYTIIFMMFIRRVPLCLFLLDMDLRVFIQLSHFGDTDLSCNLRTLNFKFQFYSREAT